MLYDFFLKNIIVFLLLFVFIIFLIILEIYDVIYSKYIISVNEALYLINNNKAVILDLRSKDLFNTCNIINSISVPFDMLDKELNILKKFKNKTIILIHNNESELNNLLKNNRDMVMCHFKNGLTEWIEAGMPVKSN